MDIKKLQAVVIEALEDVKAADIVLFDTSKLTSMFDRLVVASGTSNRQTKALAASVRDKVRESGGTVIGIEGEDTGEWVLVDLGDMVVHIMQQPIRAYYRLEEIWGGKSIDLEKAKQDAKPKTTPRKKVAVTEKTPAPKKRTTPVKKDDITDTKTKASKKTDSAVTTTKSISADRKKTVAKTPLPKKTGAKKKSSE